MRETIFLASVIRFVPNPLRNEGVNIGVVVASDDGVGVVATDGDALERVPSRDDATEAARFVLASLDEWQKSSRSAKSAGDSSAALDFKALRQIHAESTGMVQFSPPMVSYSVSANDLAQELLRRYVLPQAAPVTVPGVSLKEYEATPLLQQHKLEVRELSAPRQSSAWAASRSPADVERRVFLNTGGIHLEGHLDHDLKRDSIWLQVDKLEGISSQVRFVVLSNRLKDPVASEWVQLRQGEIVILAKGLGLMPSEIGLLLQIQ
jgi:hypothetical protein